MAFAGISGFLEVSSVRSAVDSFQKVLRGSTWRLLQKWTGLCEWSFWVLGVADYGKCDFVQIWPTYFRVEVNLLLRKPFLVLLSSNLRQLLYCRFSESRSRCQIWLLHRSSSQICVRRSPISHCWDFTCKLTMAGQCAWVSGVTCRGWSVLECSFTVNQNEQMQTLGETNAQVGGLHLEHGWTWVPKKFQLPKTKMKIPSSWFILIVRTQWM